MRSDKCMVCGKQPVVSVTSKRQWVSYLGYTLAYLLVVSPILLITGLFPITVRAGEHRSRSLCYVCMWTFGAFASIVAVIAIAIICLAITR